MKLRPIFKIHGGKYYLADWIASFFPQHKTYVEVFGGAASVFLNKEPSEIEILNDLDDSIYAIYWCLKNETDNFISSIDSLEYCENVFNEAKNCQVVNSILDFGVQSYVIRRMSRGGLCGHFAWSERKRGNRPGDENAWITMKEQLPFIAERLQNVTISNKHSQDMFEFNDALFYLDPPYLPETRTAHNTYFHDMSKEEHVSLLEILNDVKGKIILSGYKNSLYDEHLKDWRCEKRVIANHSGQGKTKNYRTECLWMNF